jgi:hypothetical protein
VTKQRETERMSIEKQEKEKSTNKNKSFLVKIVQIFRNIIDRIFKGKSYKIKNRNNKALSIKKNEFQDQKTFLRLIFCCCFDKISSTTTFIKIFTWRKQTRFFIEGKYFINFILCSILLNSIFMSIEYHEEVII